MLVGSLRPPEICANVFLTVDLRKLYIAEEVFGIVWDKHENRQYLVSGQIISWWNLQADAPRNYRIALT